MPGALYLRASGVPYKSTAIGGERFMSEVFPLMKFHGKDQLKLAVNYAKPDYTLTDLTAALPEERVRRWIIQAGKNDLDAGKTSDEVAAKLDDIIKLSTQRQIRHIYFLGLDPASMPDDNLRIPANKKIAETCGRYSHCKFVPMEWARIAKDDPITTVGYLNKIIPEIEDWGWLP